MPTIKRFGTFNICMYADDHPPPHFHVVGKGFAATVLIGTLGLDAGEVPAGVLAEALGWAADNLDLLYGEWRRLNERD